MVAATLKQQEAAASFEEWDEIRAFTSVYLHAARYEPCMWFSTLSAIVECSMYLVLFLLHRSLNSTLSNCSEEYKPNN